MPSASRNIRVLIADDHPLFRTGLRTFLEAQPGYTVVGEARDGEEAFRQAHELKPDILLLDLAMPRRPGLETLRSLFKSGLRVNIVVLTATIEKAQILEALQLGARGVVLKEAAPELLLKCMQAVRAGQYWVGRESVADLVDTLRGLMPAPPTGKAGYGLTQREMQVISAIATGLANKEIAARYALSEDTVKHHLTRIFEKLGVTNRLELALFAMNYGLWQKSK
jgi:DNA-binding NarL/FixJ family response regulator